VLVVYEKAILIAVTWFVATGCSILAIIIGFRAADRSLGTILSLGLVSILTGAMGLKSWTPFGFFPEIGWTISNGATDFSVRSGWLFIVPLVMGCLVLGVAVWNRMEKD
jgi:hypothetical protein